MITVRIDNHLKELCQIRLEQIHSSGDVSDWIVEFGIDRGDGALGLHSRKVYNFPHKQFNVLGLLKVALLSLTTEELSLESEPSSSDLER